MESLNLGQLLCKPLVKGTREVQIICSTAPFMACSSFSQYTASPWVKQQFFVQNVKNLEWGGQAGNHLTKPHTLAYSSFWLLTSTSCSSLGDWVRGTQNTGGIIFFSYFLLHYGYKMRIARQDSSSSTLSELATLRFPMLPQNFQSPGL